jgi:hypothetical protein
MIFSEFGRRGLFGPPPDLKDLDLGDPRFKVDFRDVYVTLLRRHPAGSRCGSRLGSFSVRH